MPSNFPDLTPVRTNRKQHIAPATPVEHHVPAEINSDRDRLAFANALQSTERLLGGGSFAGFRSPLRFAFFARVF